ncbi:NfeD family protein [Kangiella sediminilitoris]|uniref:Uncharacterized protein n=1 Tax=Kangiella sediminilitoris TaxID=1144748 RepID=A0A1B3B8B2_9GAMM|nr:NfeD family protein [Kangiella sediminilitoris]AOE49038.1 hypothetical protein KS2013_312 [Kangiella sediminilitoris]
MEFFSGLDYWHWLVLGLLLLILEMFAPGAILLWFGIAALIVGSLMLFLGEVLDPQWQWLIFSVFSVVSILVWRGFSKKRQREHPEEEESLNQRGKALIGQTYTLATAIEDGVGKAKVGDTYWRVTGPDLPQGEKVKVIGFEGATLKVDKAN